MKRIFAILVAFMLLMNMPLGIVFAEEQAERISIDVKFDAAEKEYIITGTVDALRGGIPMSLFLKHENNSILGAVETIAEKNDEGNVVFEFPEIPLDVITPSGKIFITVSAGYLGYVKTTDVDYNGADNQLAALKTIKAAIDSGNETTLKTAIEDTKEVLGISGAEFLNLFDEVENLNDAKSIALKNILLLKEELEDLPLAASDAVACANISEHVKLYHKQYKEAVTLGRFFELDSKEEIRAWYDANEEEYNLSENAIQTAVDDTKLLPYFDEMLKEDSFVSRMININHVSTIAELNYELKIQAVLHKIAEGSQIIVNNVITDLSSMLSNVTDQNGLNATNINLYAWNALSQDEQSAVCLEVASTKYDNLHTFINDVNTAINNAVSSGAPVYQGPSITDGGDRGGKGSSSKPVAVPNVPVAAAPIVMFEDIEDVAWAEQAIHYLYTNKIITGRDEQTFAPDDKVTRAELAKMLVLAFKLEGGNAKSFKDVNTGAWYADYVGIAASNGLILGDENGRFNPNEPVSRQDAAVMMYRAIGAKEESKNANFKDCNQISSYAMSAISYMSEKGVVNGVGDGKFAPLANITRAQAAKMLYLLLI